MASGAEVMQMLMQRGLSPVQAAALAGHMQQESGFNPTALNQNEGAFGLLQHRLDRRDNLNKFAGARGTSPGDVPTQLDFILAEMHGPEARSGSQFLSATDLPGAHAALKRFIRYGDNSDNTRLANAQALLGGGGQSIPVSPTSAAPFSMAAAGAAPQQQPVDVSKVLQLLQQNMQDEPMEEMPAMAPLQMARPVGLAAIRRLLSRLKEPEA